MNVGGVRGEVTHNFCKVDEKYVHFADVWGGERWHI